METCWAAEPLATLRTHLKPARRTPHLYINLDFFQILNMSIPHCQLKTNWHREFPIAHAYRGNLPITNCSEKNSPCVICHDNGFRGARGGGGGLWGLELPFLVKNSCINYVLHKNALGLTGVGLAFDSARLN